MDAGAPKFRRRKADRPQEIVQAALEVFAEKGFAAARLDDIARRAGVSKGALYLYFETKEELFRDVVAQAVVPNIQMLQAMAAAHPGPLRDLLGAAAVHLAGVAQTSPLGGVLKMVVGEARNFPELARVWHEQLVQPGLAAIGAAIDAAQRRGEVVPGDPRTYALQIIAPLLVAVLFRETFEPVGVAPFDMQTVMTQHVRTLQDGLLMREPQP